MQHIETESERHSFNSILVQSMKTCAAGQITGPIKQWPALELAMSQARIETTPDTPVEELEPVCAEILKAIDLHRTT